MSHRETFSMSYFDLSRRPKSIYIYIYIWSMTQLQQPIKCNIDKNIGMLLNKNLILKTMFHKHFFLWNFSVIFFKKSFITYSIAWYLAWRGINMVQNWNTEKLMFKINKYYIISAKLVKEWIIGRKVLQLKTICNRMSSERGKSLWNGSF